MLCVSEVLVEESVMEYECKYVMLFVVVEIDQSGEIWEREYVWKVCDCLLQTWVHKVRHINKQSDVQNEVTRFCSTLTLIFALLMERRLAESG